MHKSLVATRYEILRGVRCDSTKVAAHLPEKPVRVAVLLNPEEFDKTKEMTHWRNVFIDERLHDWDWNNGNFYYYSHAMERGAVADILIVYEATWKDK